MMQHAVYDPKTKGRDGMDICRLSYRTRHAHKDNLRRHVSQIVHAHAVAAAFQGSIHLGTPQMGIAKHMYREPCMLKAAARLLLGTTIWNGQDMYVWSPHAGTDELIVRWTKQNMDSNSVLGTHV
jgi:hypothetical protein